MNSYYVEESAVLEAPADRVYAIIADYHQGHPAILPANYFKAIQVTRGGYGAGTIALIKMKVLGKTVNYELVVSEPEPGRVLCEEDAATGVLTTFIVDPLEDSAQCKVTISTTARTRSGLQGWVEKLLNPAITRRIYREELAQLAQVAEKAKSFAVMPDDQPFK